jgi:predicted small integral membrane protein
MLAFVALGERFMLITRYAKTVMSLVLAIFCLLVTFDNLTDYGTNYLFVQHVMSMDTTFPGNALMYRSITSPLLWQIAYALIIAAEGVTGTLFFAGAIRLFQVRNAPAEVFNQAKIYTIGACLLAFLVWFFGFMVVAGEWFAMWQSTTWNGQEAAFRFYAAVLGVLIFVNQPDVEFPGFVPPPPVTPRRRRADKQKRSEAG